MLFKKSKLAAAFGLLVLIYAIDAEATDYTTPQYQTQSLRAENWRGKLLKARQEGNRSVDDETVKDKVSLKDSLWKVVPQMLHDFGTSTGWFSEDKREPYGYIKFDKGLMSYYSDAEKRYVILANCFLQDSREAKTMARTLNEKYGTNIFTEELARQAQEYIDYGLMAKDGSGKVGTSYVKDDKIVTEIETNRKSFTLSKEKAKPIVSTTEYAAYHKQHKGKSAVENIKYDAYFKDTEASKKLFDAVKESGSSDNKERIEDLLEEGADVNAINGDDEQISLHVVTSADITDELISKKANLIKEDKHGNTPLHTAVKNNRTEIVRTLLKYSATDPNKGDENKDTPLHIAVKNNNAKIVDALLNSSGINLNSTNNEGDTPLHIAVQNNNVAIFNAMTAALEKNGHIAVALGMTNTVGDVPLHIAAKLGNKDIVKALLKYPDLNVNSRDGNQNTALHLAAKHNNADIVNELLRITGIDPNLQNNGGKTPLQIAIEGGHTETALALINSGRVDLTSANKDGDAPLHIAVKNNKAEIVEALINSGKIDINATNAEENTALHLAAQNKNDAIIEMLTKNPDIKLNKLNKEGKTPRDLHGRRRPLPVNAWTSKQIRSTVASANIAAKKKGNLLVSRISAAKLAKHEENVKFLLATGVEESYSVAYYENKTFKGTFTLGDVFKKLFPNEIAQNCAYGKAPDTPFKTRVQSVSEFLPVLNQKELQIELEEEEKEERKED